MMQVMKFKTTAVWKLINILTDTWYVCI